MAARNESGSVDPAPADRGGWPDPFTLRPVFDLAQKEPAREAVRQIVRRMLALARSREEGIAADVDTEFLHDYRVCLRKIRSVISLLAQVYPEGEAVRLKSECRDLARETNRLRDLDVHLLDRGTYTLLLAPSLRGGLDPLFDWLRSERDEEFARVLGHLHSPAYRERMERMEAFFLEPDELPASKNSHVPIRWLASRRVDRRYRRMLRAGRSVTARTPDEIMHDIRIQGKKLRYLLELFYELYDPKEMDKLLDHLRRLQNRLGRFNDYAVQQESLLACCKELGTTAPPETLLAVGGLVTELNHKQHRERVRSQKALRRFCAGKVRHRFQQAFSKGS